LPISNRSIVSKLLQRRVAKQLVSYLSFHQLLPANQSSFWTGHSTESAITKVHSDLLDAVDRGDSAVLALLELSAAFDTVDHAMLLDRLFITFSVRDDEFGWFRSYLYGRLQFVCCCGSTRVSADVFCGVPEGSVLGPIPVIMYTVDLPGIEAVHGLSVPPVCCQ
jgi:Reverse transcriptase (RNA-dependent DNA polymerase)